MSFGFKVVNDDRIIQIDDSYPVLQFGGRGTCRAMTDHRFPRAFATSEPPWVFVRPASGTPYFMGLRFLGGPGNWYGMRIHSCADQYHNHGLAGRDHGSWNYILGEWAVAASTDQFGLRVWDGSGKLLYDAGVKYLQMEYQFQSWRYGHRRSSGGWAFVMHYLDLPASASLDDPENYLLINPFICERFIVPADNLYTLRKLKISGNQLVSVMRTGWNGGADLIEPGIIGRVSA